MSMEEIEIRLSGFSANRLLFRRAETGEAESVFRLLRSLAGAPFCAWSDDYPGMEHVLADLEAKSLYGIFDGDLPAGVGTVRHWPEHDPLAPWRSLKPCDLMRIGVAREFQGRGLGALLLDSLAAAAAADGCDGMRILVCKTNLPAQKLYRRAGAVWRGDSFSYGVNWDCLELALAGFGTKRL